MDMVLPPPVTPSEKKKAKKLVKKYSRKHNWPGAVSTLWVPQQSLSSRRVGDSRTRESHRKKRRRSAPTEPATEPAGSQHFAGWVFHDADEPLECFFAKVTEVKEVAAGEEHAGQTGVWFKQIRERQSRREDWALLSDFEMRVQSGEYKWIGHGQQGVQEAKELYKAEQDA